MERPVQEAFDGCDQWVIPDRAGLYTLFTGDRGTHTTKVVIWQENPSRLVGSGRTEVRHVTKVPPRL